MLDKIVKGFKYEDEVIIWLIRVESGRRQWEIKEARKTTQVIISKVPLPLR